MLRPPILFVILAIAFQSSQAYQVQTHGVPSSVTSPTSDGAHGVPSSILSPTPVNRQGSAVTFRNPNSRVIFGNPRTHRRRNQVVVVPLFYPSGYYPAAGVAADPAASGEQEAQGDPEADSGGAPPDSSALRDAYNRGAQDALAQQQKRYGEHYFDSRERKGEKAAAPAPPKESKETTPSKAEDRETASASEPARAPQREENAQPTIFIFKDGRKIETQNFAIVGQTLFDMSAKPMRKIPLADLNLEATRHANDDIGNSIALPAN